MNQGKHFLCLCTGHNGCRIKKGYSEIPHQYKNSALCALLGFFGVQNKPEKWKQMAVAG
jgi:hypothetical protein